MDAIMAALAAVLLANADGRSASLLSALVDGRGSRRLTVILFYGCFIVNATAAAVAAIVADQMLGQGVLRLFAAMALLSAAAALAWTRRPPLDVAAMLGEALPVLGVRLALLAFGDRSQFLIFALAATSGAGLWAVVGGTAGLTIAMLPVLAFGPALLERRAAQALRWAAVLVLLLWAVVQARLAFGV